MFCLVGLVPEEGGESQNGGGEAMKVEMEEQQEEYKSSGSGDVNCEKVFEDRSQLSQQEQSEWECEICKSFFSSSQISVHRRSCRKNLACPYCGKTFRLNHQVSNHIKFKCNFAHEEPPDSAPDWIRVEPPAALCEVSISDHDYFCSKTETEIQLKTSAGEMFAASLDPSLQSDLVLVSSDGVRSPCHAAILAVSSPLLANILPDLVGTEVEKQEILLEWESHLVTSLLQYLYTGQVRLSPEKRERLEEMMAQLGIASRDINIELKEELEVGEHEEQLTENPSSHQQRLKPCWVKMENIKPIIEKKMLTETEEADLSMQEDSILLKPQSNDSIQSVKKHSLKLSRRVRRNNTKPSILRQHEIKEHSGPKKFPCPDCEKIFNFASKLRAHQSTHHGGPWRNPDNVLSKCTVCFKTFASKRVLADHMGFIHKKKKGLNCNICGFKTRLKTEMYTHLGNTHQILINKSTNSQEREKHYTCDPEAFSYEPKRKVNDFVICSICGVETKWKIEHHMRVFHDKIQCQDCGLTLSGEKELKAHCRRHHAKKVLMERNEGEVNPDFICATCGKGYTNKRTYENHLSSHKKTYHQVCDHCGEEFDKRETYTKHFREQHPEALFSCEICSFKTTHENLLKRHHERHQNTKLKPKARCEDCGKEFSELSVLNRHVKEIHLGLKAEKKKGKTWSCPTCSKTFNRKDNLAYHMNVHTGAKPYKCFYCETAFQNQSNRLNHMKKSHPDQHQKKNQAVVTETQYQITMSFVQ